MSNTDFSYSYIPDNQESSLLVLKVNKNGNVITCSKRLFNLLNYNEKSRIGLNISDIVDYVSSEYTFEEIKNILNSGTESFSVEHRMVTAYQKPIYVYAQYTCEKNHINGNEYLSINFIDITSNKKREIKSKKEGIIKEELLEYMNSNIAVIDKEENFLYLNKAMESFLEEIKWTTHIGKDINVFGPGIATCIRKVMNNPKLRYEFDYGFQLSYGNKYFNVEIKNIDNDKCSISMNNIKKYNGRKFTGDNNKVGIVYDNKEGFTYFNNRACEILGIENKDRKLKTKFSEYKEKNFEEELFDKFPDVNNTNNYSKKVEQKYVLLSTSLYNVRINGDKKSVYFLEDKTQDMQTSVFDELASKTNQDIFESKEYDRLKNEFFANISHELRTPTNVIFSIVQLMEKNKQLGNNNYHNKVLKQNCYRLVRTINNLIETTKIDAGHITLVLENYNIVSVVEEITLSVANFIEDKGLRLVFDSEIEEKIMACDVEKIESIILNLLANAAKFTSPGDTIEVYIEEESSDYIRIHVKDTGVGIPRDKRKIIFDHFRQVDKSLFREHEGSGIGLSLVKSFVELHGGEVFVESRESIGSEFTVRLPISVIENNIVVNYEEYFKERIIDKINIEFSDIYFSEAERQEA